MSQSSPVSISFATALTWLALAVLALAILSAGVVLVPVSQSMAEMFPEFAELRAPLLVLAFAVGFSVEMILAITAILVGYISRNRMFGAGARRLVDVLLAAVIVTTILIACSLVFIPGPPVLALMVLVTVLAGVALTLVLMVLRSLLLRAIFMRVELDEVV